MKVMVIGAGAMGSLFCCILKQAGNDILLFTTISDDLIQRVIQIIKNHIRNDVISKNRIHESYERIKKLKQKIV